MDKASSTKADFVNTFPHLPHAPITEAIIDIRAELPPDVTLEDLSRFQLGIESRFSKRAERRSLKTTINLQGDTPTVSMPPPEPDGYLFTSESERLIAQARRDGFTLSRLNPYHEGGQFIQEAQELWQRYADIVGPVKVTRLAVRNVNRINIEVGAALERYILTGPSIARALPQFLAGYFLRMQLPDPSGSHAVVTQAFGQSSPENQVVPLIFDIDAFKEVELLPGDSEIWNIISELRSLKNRIFFNSVTGYCLERYR